jgi:hypothetical protein
MKPSLWPVIAAASLVGCGLAASLTQFDTTLTAQGEIAGTFNPDEQFGAYSSVGSTISQTLSSKGVTGFKSAMIASGTFSVPSSESANLADVSSFSISVSASGLPTVEIAHQSSTAFMAAPSSGSVPLIIDPNVELKPYINQGGATFSATMPLAVHPIGNTPVTIDLDLHVQVL